MYIITKFKDYYDSVAHSVGVDKTIQYKRETSNILNTTDITLGHHNFLYPLSYPWVQREKLVKTALAIIGFCGKLYVFGHKDGEGDYEFEYGNNIEKLIYKRKSKQELRWDKKFNDTKKDKQRLRDIVDKYHLKERHDIFHELKVPIFVCILRDEDHLIPDSPGRDRNQIILNPDLEWYKFQTMVDPFTAFQEIQMYISGVLGTSENETIDVSNKDKISKHGFDKFSFRSEPGKKPNRKNKK